MSWEMIERKNDWFNEVMIERNEKKDWSASDQPSKLLEIKVETNGRMEGMNNAINRRTNERMSQRVNKTNKIKKTRENKQI